MLEVMPESMCCIRAPLPPRLKGPSTAACAIAVSLEYDKKIYDFPTAAKYARQVIEQILATRPAEGSLFNVNIPVLERGPIKGVKVLPQNVSPYTEKFDRRVNPRGRTYFWASPDFLCPDPHPGSDVEALRDSLSPSPRSNSTSPITSGSRRCRNGNGKSTNDPVCSLMWSLWTAFENGFDETNSNAPKSDVLDQNRLEWTRIYHFEPPISGFHIFDPPPHPPFSIKIESVLENPLFLTC